MPDVPVLAPANAAAGAETSAKGKRRIPWLIVIIGVALLLIGLGAALLLTQSSKGAAGHTRAAAEKKPSGPPLYLALDPPFVVNFQADQIVRFLQVSVEVMSRDPKTLDLLKANDPVLRNDLLMLLANQKYAVIATSAGKEQLRAQALASIRKDLAQAGGDPKRVEAVYFTSFVMQ
ncbi:MAG TPA: flagellar basal body-associated FliL family protein [Steroidobacteraceae bacterium]|nr:flagellar basal body-associated FliL family protein [Steroidobacteraceae bacterium]